MSRPSFQFYPDDWMNDLALRGCSPTARAIWIDLMCIMHQGVPYGALADSRGAIPVAQVARQCGVTLKVLVKALEELEKLNVFSRDEHGVIFSRRMVRDEHNRLARGQHGGKSLNSAAVPRPKSPKSASTEGIHYVDDKGIHDVDTKGIHRTEDEEEVVVGLVVNTELQKKPLRAKVEKKPPAVSERFEEVWQRWPLRSGKDSAAIDWISVVTVENEPAVLGCVERYLGSQAVAEGKVQRLGSTVQKSGWLIDCARDGWECDWPRARDSPGVAVRTKQQEQADAWDRA